MPTLQNRPMSQTALPSHIYHIDPQYRTMVRIGMGMFVLGFGVIFPAIVVTSGLHALPVDPIGTGMVAGLSIIATIYNVWASQRWLQHTCLSIDADQLVYHTPGLDIETPWSNVKYVQVRYGQAELILCHPAASRKSFSIVFRQATTSAGRHLDRRIPLSIFTLWAPQSRLYQDIAQFAPHLINKV